MLFRVRRLGIAMLALVFAIVAIPAFDLRSDGQLTFGLPQAHAQQAKPKKKRRSLFSTLFGRKKAKKKKVVKKTVSYQP